MPHRSRRPVEGLGFRGFGFRVGARLHNILSQLVIESLDIGANSQQPERQARQG